MKVLVLKLLLICLPFITVFLGIEYTLGKAANSHKKKIAFLEKNVGEIELIIMGSSQAYDGIDPDCFNLKTFNMANVSQTIYYDTQLLNKFLPLMKNLKVAILPLSYFSFETDVSDSSEAFRCFFYQRYYGISWPEPTLNNLLDIRNFSLYALYGKEQSRILLKNRQQYTDLAPFQTFPGWNRLDGNGADINERTGRETVARHHQSMKSRHVFRNRALLEGTLQELKARGILTIIVTPPVHTTYSNHIDPLRYQFFLNIVTDICTRYGITYRNYMNDRRFSQLDFYDNDHLNMKGARKFSALLNSEVNLLSQPNAAAFPRTPVP